MLVIFSCVLVLFHVQLKTDSSPALVGLSEPAVLIPNVYDQRYLQQRLSEGVIDYLNDENKGFVQASLQICDLVFGSVLIFALLLILETRMPSDR